MKPTVEREGTPALLLIKSLPQPSSCQMHCAVLMIQYRTDFMHDFMLTHAQVQRTKGSCAPEIVTDTIQHFELSNSVQLTGELGHSGAGPGAAGVSWPVDCGWKFQAARTCHNRCYDGGTSGNIQMYWSRAEMTDWRLLALQLHYLIYLS